MKISTRQYLPFIRFSLRIKNYQTFLSMMSKHEKAFFGSLKINYILFISFSKILQLHISRKRDNLYMKSNVINKISII